MDAARELLFGLTRDDVRETVTWHLDQATATFPADRNSRPEDTATDANQVTELALAQLEAPFECWKFGDLCEATGPDRALQLVEAFWTDALGADDTSQLLERASEAHEAAHDEWLSEYDLTEEEVAAYQDLIGAEPSPHRMVCPPGIPNIAYHPSSSVDHIRVRAGITNLALYVSMWANTQYYEDGSNVSSFVCIDGIGYGTLFFYSNGQPIGSSDLPDPYNEKCKTTKKVTTNRNWWGGVYDSYGSTGVGTGAAVVGSGNACRPSE